MVAEMLQNFYHIFYVFAIYFIIYFVYIYMHITCFLFMLYISIFILFHFNVCIFIIRKKLLGCKILIIKEIFMFQ